MNKTILILILGGIVIVVGVVFFMMGSGNEETTENTSSPTAQEAPVKEFVMDSFVVFEENGAPKPQFSVKEITVNKGDRVRVKVTNTAGTHDFKLDEFSVFAETPLNEEVTIEFVADQAGEFVYYCNQPGHRELGHWGTLTVLE